LLSSTVILSEQPNELYGNESVSFVGDFSNCPHTHTAYGWDIHSVINTRTSGTSAVSLTVTIDSEQVQRTTVVDWHEVVFPYGPNFFVTEVEIEQKVDEQWVLVTDEDHTLTLPHSDNSSTITFTGNGFQLSNGEGFFISEVGMTAISPDVAITTTSWGNENPTYDDPTGGPQDITVVVSRSGAPNDVELRVRLSDIAPPDPNVSFMPYGPDPLEYEPADENDIGNVPDSVLIPEDENEVEFTITVLDDEVLEALEAFTLYIEPPIQGQHFYTKFEFADRPATKPAIDDNDWEIDAFSMSFANSQGLLRDNGNTFAGADWLDADGDRQPDRDPYPASYRRSLGPADETRPTASVTVGIEGELSGDWTIRGEGPAGFEFEATGITAGGSGVTKVIESEEVLADVIRYTEDLAITWTVERLAPKDPDAVGEPPVQDEAYGETENDMYVTGAAAGGAHITPVHVGTTRATGLAPLDQPSRAQIIDKIWDEFADRSVVRFGNTEPMRYTHVGTFAMRYEDMLAHPHGLGQCTAWTELLIATARFQGVQGVGIDGVAVQMRPQAADLQFVLKAMPAQGTGAANYGVREFTMHEIVQFPDYPERIFDPSYGGTPFEAERGHSARIIYENQVIVGIKWYDPVKQQILEREDTVDQEDLAWAPRNPQP
jgi:hypothetical protein